MATLTYQTSTFSGVALNLVAASAGGDKIAPNLRGVVLVRNGDASATTVTVVVPGTQYGQERPDYTVTVAAGATTSIGPLVNDLVGTDGLVSLTYSKVTALTVGALQV